LQIIDFIEANQTIQAAQYRFNAGIENEGSGALLLRPLEAEACSFSQFQEMAKWKPSTPIFPNHFVLHSLRHTMFTRLGE
jgi:hypothetical protein